MVCGCVWLVTMGCGAQDTWKVEAERRQHEEQVKDTSEKLSRREQEHAAEMTKLKMDNATLKEAVKQLGDDLAEENELWKQERAKTVSMMFGHLPLPLLERAAGVSATKRNVSSAALLQHLPVLNQTYPNTVLACCNVVGFHRLVNSLSAAQAVELTDRIHILVDRAFSGSTVHVLEKSGDCCCAVSSLSTSRDQHMQRPTSTKSIRGRDQSVGGSSAPARQAGGGGTGDEDNLHLLPGAVEDTDTAHTMPASTRGRHGNEAHVMSSTVSKAGKESPSPAQCAKAMAESSLRLMASTVELQLPGQATLNQLQLRIALHTGMVHLGVAGLTQHTSGLSPEQLKHSTPVPKVNVLGCAYSEALQLRDTSLPLQIRVSHAFRQLLLAAGTDCILEQCPDFPQSGDCASNALKHTHWLVGMKSVNVALPPLDRAVHLESHGDA